jgi:hypothetical protein
VIVIDDVDVIGPVIVALHLNVNVNDTLVVIAALIVIRSRLNPSSQSSFQLSR